MNIDWGDWLRINEFKSHFSKSNQEMKFELGIKLFYILETTASLKQDKYNMEWFGKCKKNSMNMNQILQTTLNTDDHILLNVIKDDNSEEIKCKFWKMDDKIEYAIDCNPRICTKCGFPEFLNLMKIKPDKHHQTILLYSERGSLSSDDWRIQIKPNKYYLGFDLGVIELRQVSWKLNIKNNVLTTNNISLKNCNAMLNLFDINIPIDGNLQFTIYDTSTELNINGHSKLRDIHINPLQWIELKVAKIFTVNSIFVKVEVVAEKDNIDKSIHIVSNGSFMGKSSVLLFGVMFLFLF